MQLSVKIIECYNIFERTLWLENMLLLVLLHWPPISCKPVVAYVRKSVMSKFFILYDQASALQELDLLVYSYWWFLEYH